MESSFSGSDYNQSMCEEVVLLTKHNLGLHDQFTFEQSKANLQNYFDLFLVAHDVVAVQYPPVTAEHIALEQDHLFDIYYLLDGQPSVRQSNQLSFTADFAANIQVRLQLEVADLLERCLLCDSFVPSEL